MKKRFFAILSIAVVLVFAIAAFAYTQNTTAKSGDKPSCCKSTDSCPMKAKGHDASGEHAKMSCCKKHDGDHAKHEGAACDCCGDSCPMKRGERAATAGSATDEGKDCCDNCDCCKGKTEKSA